MALSTFESFAAEHRAAGCDEVLERRWKPHQVMDTHTHPFSVEAVVAQGEMWLTVGTDTKHVRAGEGFQLEHSIPHSERYGAEETVLWVARRNRPK